MVKGRRLVSSRSERFLGSHAYSNSPDTTTWSDNSELGEEDIWSMVDDVADRNHRIVNSSLGVWSSRTGGDSNGNIPMRSRLRIQRDEHHVGGLSLAFEDSSGNKTSPRIVHQFRGHDAVSTTPRHMATSAPVNVPDWSKILRVDSVESLQDLDDGDDDLNSEMIPPHEYLAREYRRTAGASVFEGVGRTLKGRDLRRVRDAVWSQTGFDG